MKPESYKLIAQLFESFVQEDSTAMGVIGNLPGGRALVKKMHSSMNLAHDQQYTQVDKISWSQLKDAYKGAWVLIKGAKGAGAIRASSGSYESVAVNGQTGEVESFRNDRGGSNIDFLKGHIGKLQAFYVGKETGSAATKKRDRAANKAGVGEPQSVTKDTLVKKFKPLWVRAMTAAEADVKGMITTMIKNGAYDKAERKLSILKSLQRATDAIESGELESAPEWLQGAVQSAIAMAASHHYPQDTGELSKSRWTRDNSLTPANSAGMNQVLRDIAGGDTAKLGTVLGFFKRNLITG
jgi:hypothetical protein